MAFTGNHTALRNCFFQFRELVQKKLIDWSRFSKEDSAYITEYITYNSIWNKKQMCFVYDFLSKFKDDLSLNKIPFNEIEDPSVAHVPKVIEIDSNANQVGYNGVEFTVRFKFEQRLVDKIKKIQGAKWDAEKRVWRVPAIKVDQVREFASKYNFVIGDNASRMMYNVEENLEQSYSAERIDLNLPLKMELFDYQTVGVDYALRLGRTLNADCPGLGKTCQGIGFAIGVNQWPVLVICPKSLRYNWQNEWHMWTNKKALVADSKLMKQLPSVIESGMCQVLIVNYNALKTYFIQEIKKDGRGTSVILNKNASLFKNIIIDECFPYETPIITNKGILFIGDIVENKIECKVLSYDFSTKKLVYSPIKKYRKNTFKDNLIKIKLSNGKELVCTENHKIYVKDHGYKKAKEISKGEDLFVLSESIQDIIQITRASKILQWILWFEKQFSNTREQSKIVFARNKEENIRIKSKNNTEQTTYSKSTFREDENKKSNAQSRDIGKNETIKERSNILVSWWKWTVDKTTNKISRSNWIANGIFYFNKRCSTFIHMCTQCLQGRFSVSRSENSDRNRREYSQVKKVEVSGQKKNGNIEFVRLESSEILESGSRQRLRSMRKKNYVYDFEIEDTHNYFANGILVSNCHELRNQKIVPFKAAKKMLSLVDKCVLLSGTPILNEINDMASQLDLLGVLDSDFEGRWKFNKRYGAIGKKEFEKDKNKERTVKISSEELLKELNLKTRAKCMIRREKYQVLKELPDKIRTIHEVELSNQAEYDHAYLSLQDYMAANGASNAQINKAMQAEIMVRIGILKKLSARGKINDFIEYANELISNGEKVVVFAWHKEILYALKKVYPNIHLITGDQTDEEIRDSVKAFQENPDVMMIGATYKRGGVGHTLTAAHHWACLELPWTDGILTQAEDREHRISQKETVYCRYFFGRGTIDHDIYNDIILRKRNVSKHATDSREETEELSQMELIKKMVEKRNKTVVAN